MEIALAIIAVLILAWIADAHEKRMVRKIQKDLDRVMGRDD